MKKKSLYVLIPAGQELLMNHLLQGHPKRTTSPWFDWQANKKVTDHKVYDMQVNFNSLTTKSD